VQVVVRVRPVSGAQPLQRRRAPSMQHTNAPPSRAPDARFSPAAAEEGQGVVVEVSSDNKEARRRSRCCPCPRAPTSRALIAPSLYKCAQVSLHEPCAENDYLARLRVRARRWAYDAAFGPASTSAAVYAASAAPLVADVAAGAGNATVFCYGATGAGKTHTMLGTSAAPGVMVLAIAELFDRLGSEAGAEVSLAYLEIYNENVRDLFAAAGVSGSNGGSNGAKASLELREDPLHGVMVSGLTHVSAGSAAEVLGLLQRGNACRVTEPTRANATSSRSHAVLQVFVRRACFAHTSKLSLIDLAGSERALATDIRTVRSAEGACINKSLLALSSCIHALVEGRRHVPYRNSRLTQLLKDSLGGGCRTAMIANVSPSVASFGESQNTLHWADRAKEIRTAPQAERDAAEAEATARAEAEAVAAAEAASAEAAAEAAAAAAASCAADAAATIAALRAENEALRRRVAAAAEAEAEEAAGGRARTRRRCDAATLFSPAAASRPPFLTASAPNLAFGMSPRPSPRPGTRAALAEETEALRDANADLQCRNESLEAAVAAAETERETERAEWAAASDRWRAAKDAVAAEADAARAQLAATEAALADARAEAAAARCDADAIRTAAAGALAAAAREAAQAAAMQAQQEQRPLALDSLLSPAGASMRCRTTGATPRRASYDAQAGRACLGDVTNEAAALAAETRDDVAPLSAVKATIRTFDHLAAHGTTAGTTAARPVPPSPGRIMTSQLYRRFKEMEDARLAAGIPPPLPPVGSPGAAPLSRANSLASTRG